MRTLVFAGGKIAICSENYRDPALKCSIKSFLITCCEFMADCYVNVYNSSLKIIKISISIVINK
ncbi:hypothetical protein EQP49_01980 [Yersinia sp. 2105 StPb PI]|nr:hypothetical protein EQP49_01980 [Yersinia sp. 2105 StPb PI]